MNKLDNIFKELNFKYRISPVSITETLKKDASDFNESKDSTGFSKFVERVFYNFKLPEDFTAKSVIIMAAPSPASVIGFNYKNKYYKFLLPPDFKERQAAPEAAKAMLRQHYGSGFHFQPAPGLPEKLLAARSGLGLYGRNNLVYIEGLGTYVFLFAFYTDIECGKMDIHEISRADMCSKCSQCIENCPTGAIEAGRKTINVEKCMTYLNEFVDLQPFPDWLETKAHNSIFGCIACQKNCPMNHIHIENTLHPFDFTEEETNAILLGKKYDELPESTIEKLDAVCIGDYLHLLPRNLKILIEKENTI